MVTLSPVGLAAAPVANQAAFLATFKEKLCRCVCATSTNQPFATVTYRNETPVLNEPEDWQNRDGSRCYYRGQWKNGNLRYS